LAITTILVVEMRAKKATPIPRAWMRRAKPRAAVRIFLVDGRRGMVQCMTKKIVHRFDA
jgi:hypothetical protein